MMVEKIKGASRFNLGVSVTQKSYLIGHQIR